MLQLSIELLVEIEDTGSINRVALLKGRQSRMVYGALGQMENRGWLKSTLKKGERFITLTSVGQRFIEQTLAQAKQDSPWDGAWRVVLFDIPENRRSLRSRLRLLLKEMGFGQFQASVWASPRASWNTIEQFAIRHNLEKRIYFLQVTDWHGIEERIHAMWDFSQIKKSYLKFISEGLAILNKPSSSTTRLFAKKLIFFYAITHSLDPLLPSKLLPQHWPYENARALYKKLRPLAQQNEP